MTTITRATKTTDGLKFLPEKMPLLMHNNEDTAQKKWTKHAAGVPTMVGHLVVVVGGLVLR